MATITTHIPTGNQHLRNALVAAVAVLIAVGVTLSTWSLVGSDDSADSGQGSSVTTDQVQPTNEAYFSANGAEGMQPTTLEQAKARTEAYLRVHGVEQSQIKSSDQVRAEFEAQLREQRPEPVEIKSSDQVRAEFEASLRAANAPQTTTHGEVWAAHNASGVYDPVTYTEEWLVAQRGAF